MERPTLLKPALRQQALKRQMPVHLKSKSNNGEIDHIHPQFSFVTSEAELGNTFASVSEVEKVIVKIPKIL